MAETVVSSNVPSTSRTAADSSTASVATRDDQCGSGGLKTIEILMGWPIVSLTANKIQNFYESLRSNTILNRGCKIFENVNNTLYGYSSPFRAILCPAIRIIDLATSDLAETVQKKLPVVRQSPAKVYEAVKSGFYKRIAPLWDKIEFTTKSGERRIRKIARKFAVTSRKLVAALNRRMEDIEKYLKNYYSKGVKAPQVTDEDFQTRPIQTTKWIPVKTAFRWATAIAMFSVGIAARVASGLPLVGQFFMLSTSPASSKSTSPTRDLKSTSSSYESIPESTEAETKVKMRRSMLNLVLEPSAEPTYDE